MAGQTQRRVAVEAGGEARVSASYLNLGEMDDALIHALGAIEFSRPAGEDGPLATALGVHAEVSSERGDHDAEIWARRALETARVGAARRGVRGGRCGS